MPRTMYDDIDAGNIPADADLMAGYVDGHWPSYQPMRDRFPNAQVFSITVYNGDALVLDCETGDATPQMVGSWVQRQQSQGKRTVVYCNSSTWPAVQHDCEMHGVRPDGYWIAQYDNDPTIPQEWIAAGCVAKQYQSTDQYDLSSVLDTWPGLVSAAPTPAGVSLASFPPFGVVMDAELFVRWCYAFLLIRDPDQSGLDTFIAYYNANGPAKTFTAILDSAEGQKRQAQRRHLLDAQPV